jgi:hypothetical protein
MNKSLNAQSFLFLLLLIIVFAFVFSPPRAIVSPVQTPALPSVSSLQVPVVVQKPSLTILKPFHVCPKLLSSSFNPVQKIWSFKFSDVPARWVALRFENAALESSVPFSGVVSFPVDQSTGSWVLRVDSCSEMILNR